MVRAAEQMLMRSSGISRVGGDGSFTVPIARLCAWYFPRMRGWFGVCPSSIALLQRISRVFGDGSWMTGDRGTWYVFFPHWRG